MAAVVPSMSQTEKNKKVADGLANMDNASMGGGGPDHTPPRTAQPVQTPPWSSASDTIEFLLGHASDPDSRQISDSELAPQQPVHHVFPSCPLQFLGGIFAALASLQLWGAENDQTRIQH